MASGPAASMSLNMPVTLSTMLFRPLFSSAASALRGRDRIGDTHVAEHCVGDGHAALRQRAGGLVHVQAVHHYVPVHASLGSDVDRGLVDPRLGPDRRIVSLTTSVVIVLFMLVRMLFRSFCSVVWSELEPRLARPSTSLSSVLLAISFVMPDAADCAMSAWFEADPSSCAVCVMSMFANAASAWLVMLTLVKFRSPSICPATRSHVRIAVAFDAANWPGLGS